MTSGHCYYWNFYHLKIFVNFEINDIPPAQGWGYIGDATVLPNQAPIISLLVAKDVWSLALLWWHAFPSFQFWPFLFNCFLQFYKLLAINMWIDRSVAWKRIKMHNTFVISPNWQHDLLLMMQFSFQYGLCWFIMLGSWFFLLMTS